MDTDLVAKVGSTGTDARCSVDTEVTHSEQAKARRAPSLLVSRRMLRRQSVVVVVVGAATTERLAAAWRLEPGWPPCCQSIEIDSPSWPLDCPCPLCWRSAAGCISVLRCVCACMQALALMGVVWAGAIWMEAALPCFPQRTLPCALRQNEAQGTVRSGIIGACTAFS